MAPDRPLLFADGSEILSVCSVFCPVRYMFFHACHLYLRKNIPIDSCDCVTSALTAGNTEASRALRIKEALIIFITV